MTISDFIASGKGGSRATVYTRLHEAGINIDDLRGADGQLTDAGLAILGSVFDDVSRDQTQVLPVTGSGTTSGNISGTASREAETAITIPATEYADLIRRLATAEAIAEERLKRIEDLQMVISDLQEAQRRLLPAVTESPATDQRRGLFGWFKRRM